MRFVLKSLFWLLPLYLGVIGGFAWLFRSVIDESANALMAETARMVGGEVASAISHELVDEILATPTTDTAEISPGHWIDMKALRTVVRRAW